jgi:hypothetical protein
MTSGRFEKFGNPGVRGFALDWSSNFPAGSVEITRRNCDQTSRSNTSSARVILKERYLKKHVYDFA